MKLTDKQYCTVSDALAEGMDVVRRHLDDAADPGYAKWLKGVSKQLNRAFDVLEAQREASK